MRTEDIIKLVGFVNSCNIDELMVKSGKEKVVIKNGKVNILKQKDKNKVVKNEKIVDEDNSVMKVTSPLVGTFYSAASAEHSDYVKTGDTIKKGHVLGIVEAMKVMNEITSEYDGVVEKVLVKNQQIVEYGQVLFEIR